MDTTVIGIAAVVVAELRTAGYMESTIGQYEKSIKALTSFVEDRGGVYTPSLGAAFASMTVSPRTGRFSVARRSDYGRLVRVFDTYLDTGRVQLAPRKRGGGGPQPGSGEFTALNDAWEADMDDRGLAPATRAAYGRVARGYLVFLESHGISCLDSVDGASVLGFLESLSGRVGEVFVVLGGVEFPSVLEVHRPHRPGGRGQPGRSEAISCDLAGAQRRG